MTSLLAIETILTGGGGNFSVATGVRKVAEKSVSDDAQLVEAALAGDRDAFGLLVERYQDRLFNTLARYLGNRADAGDVLQDALVKAFVKLRTFRGASQFYTWLYRIAMNTAISAGRRSRPNISVDQLKDQGGGEPVDPCGGPDEGIVGQEKIEQVQSALNELPDDSRQILVLREFEECSYQAISEILGLPVGTVRSRLFRARTMLRDRLKALV